MSFINGRDRILYIKSGDDWLPIGCLVGNSFEETSEMVNSTVRGNTNGWIGSIPSLQSYSISFEGVLTDDLVSTTVITYYALQTLKRGRTLIDWRIESVDSGFEYGQGYLTQISNTNNVDEFVTFSGVIIGMGDISTGFLLLETGSFIFLETGGKIKLE